MHATSARDGTGEGEFVLLLRTWDDGEAEIVRSLLETYEIRCQVVSDVVHSLIPLTVDGLGEVRILVAAYDLEAARDVLAEHRRQGMEIVPGGKEDDGPEGGEAG